MHGHRAALQAEEYQYFLMLASHSASVTKTKQGKATAAERLQDRSVTPITTGVPASIFRMNE